MSFPTPPLTGAGARVGGMFGTAVGWGTSAFDLASSAIQKLGNFPIEPLGINVDVDMGQYTISARVPTPPEFRPYTGPTDFTITGEPPEYDISEWEAISVDVPDKPQKGDIDSIGNWDKVDLPESQNIFVTEMRQPTPIIKAGGLTPVAAPGLGDKPAPFLEKPIRFDGPDPIGEIQIDMPPMPDINVADYDIAIGPAPEFYKDAPELVFGEKPTPERPLLPDPVDDLIDINQFIPDSFEAQFPELPTFEELNLPEPPSLDKNIQFNEEMRPVKNIQIPDTSFLESHQITEYDSALLDELRVEISRMLKGGTGLPPAIEQMIFDRSRVREDEAAQEALMDSLDDWASRGFDLPSGVLDAKREKIRQKTQDNAATLNRELTIYAHEKEIENLRFSIEQGVAAETMLSQLHLSTEQIKFQLATGIAEMLMNKFRGEIEMYNADVNAFRVEAEIFRERVRAELAKVELYRGEIEAARVAGEINQQKVQLYTAQIESVNTLANVYATRMQAAEIVGRTNEQKLRNYGQQIAAFTAQIQANAEEFRAYLAETQAETAKMDGFEAQVRAFSARTQAYAAESDAKAIGPRLKLEAERTRMQGYQTQGSVYGTQGQLEIARTTEAWRANTTALVEKYRAEAAYFGSLAQAVSAEASTYSAGAQVESAHYSALTAQEAAEREYYRAQATEAQANASTAASYHSAQASTAGAKASVAQAQGAVASANANAQAAQLRSEGARASAQGSALAAFYNGIGAVNNAQATSARTQAARFSAEASAEQAKQSSFQSKMAYERAKISGTIGAYQAHTALYSGEAQIYNGQAQMYAADLRGSEAQGRLNLEATRGAFDLALKAEEINLQASIQQTQTLVEALRGAAQAASQLAAASMSAVNASAQISESGVAQNSWATQWTYNRNYAYEM